MYYTLYDNGAHEPVFGETINVVGAGSETAEIWSYSLLSGSWGAGTAYGVVYFINCSQDFIDNFEYGDWFEDEDSNTIAQSVQALGDNCDPVETGKECYLKQITARGSGMECMRSFNTDDIDVEIHLDMRNWP